MHSNNIIFGFYVYFLQMVNRDKGLWRQGNSEEVTYAIVKHYTKIKHNEETQVNRIQSVCSNVGPV